MNNEKIITMLQLVQNNMAPYRGVCDEGEKMLWDDIDAAIAFLSKRQPDAAVAAITYTMGVCDATDDHDGILFLKMWLYGEFDYIRKTWPDAPEAVFIGADPLYEPKPKEEEAVFKPWVPK